MVQALRPVFFHQYNILNSYSEFTGHINSGLDAKCHPFLQIPAVYRLNLRLFMGNISDSMAQAAGKIRSVPLFLNQSSGGLIDIRNIRSQNCLLSGCPICLFHNMINLLLL